MSATPTTAPAGGLFEQLAKQQLAPEPPRHGLRPQLPYPFEDIPPSFRVEGEQDAASPSMSPTDSHPARDRAQRAKHEAPQLTAVDSPLVSTAPAPVSRARESSYAQPRQSISTNATEQPRTAAPSPLDEWSEPLSHRPTIAPALRSESPPDRPHSPEASIQVTTTVAHAAAEVPPATAASKNQAPPAFELPRLKPRLPTPPAPVTPAQRQEASEPTIEIHIGRVEVRAQVAPSTPPPPQRPAPADQRLAAYLSNRGNGARS